MPKYGDDDFRLDVYLDALEQRVADLEKAAKQPEKAPQPQSK